MRHEEPALTPNALRVLQSRYLLRGAHAETPGGLFRRVARAVSAAEAAFGGDTAFWENRFFNLLGNLWFLPNSPTLMNAGLERQQLSACFVLPVGDSIDDIFSTLHRAALIHQSGGGTGFNFSAIRPKGDPLGDEPATASGPVSFIKLFDAATEKIKQGGKRRGANMGILDITHPDIEQFIEAKEQPGEIGNFNLSVGITDAFMRAVDENDSWQLLHPVSGAVVRSLPARELWDRIARLAHACGDPGIVFLDRLEEANPVPAAGRIRCTNPCGEVPLLPFEACNLGSVNLPAMMKKENGDWLIDWEKLSETVHLAIRFLDNVIEVNSYLLPETEGIVKANRKIGLGVMGWGDMLLRLRIPYASEEAVQTARGLMRFIRDESRKASATLAAERGVFPNWEKSVFYPAEPLRNATCTAVAPTGTISVIAGVSSSIEPLFALAYRRSHTLGGEDIEETDACFIETVNELGLDEKTLRAEALREGNLAKANISREIRDLFLTAYEIAPEWHLQHQAAFQEFTDNAVSKTINLPKETTEEETSRIFHLAWKLGLKGITVFREGSRNSVVLQPGLSCRVCETGTDGSAN